MELKKLNEEGEYPQEALLTFHISDPSAWGDGIANFYSRNTPALHGRLRCRLLREAISSNRLTFGGTTRCFARKPSASGVTYIEVGSDV